VPIILLRLVRSLRVGIPWHSLLFLILFFQGFSSDASTEFDWLAFKVKSDSLIQEFRKDESLEDELYKLSIDSSTIFETPVYANYLIELGNSYARHDKYPKATSIVLDALSIHEAREDYGGVAHVYAKLAFFKYIKNNHEKSIQYVNQGFQALEKVDSLHHMGFSRLYNVLALVYYDLDILDSAEYYFNQAISFAKNANPVDYHMIAVCNDNLAMLYEINDQKEKAIGVYKESIKYYEQINNIYDLAWSHYHIARSHIGLKNKSEAIYHIKKSEAYNEQINSIEIGWEIGYNWLFYVSTFNLTDSVMHYLNKYDVLTDKLISAKVKQNVQEVEAKYELDKNRNKLKLSKENEARLSAENETQRVALIASFLVLLVVSFVFVFAYRNYKQKRKINELALSVKDSKLEELIASQETKVFASLLKGQNEERERIAQDLHDRLGGTLATLKMSLRKPENKISNDDMDLVNLAVKEVRNISHNLSSGLVQKYGFNQAIEQLVRRIEESEEIAFELSLLADLTKQKQDVSIELYRITQELVSNTLKHAEATEVSIQTSIIGENFNLIYEDNGVGFDSMSPKGGIGLENIRKRVKKLNGELNIDSAPGRGTIVIIEVNL